MGCILPDGTCVHLSRLDILDGLTCKECNGTNNG